MSKARTILAAAMLSSMLSCHSGTLEERACKNLVRLDFEQDPSHAVHQLGTPESANRLCEKLGNAMDELRTCMAAARIKAEADECTHAILWLTRENAALFRSIVEIMPVPNSESLKPPI